MRKGISKNFNILLSNIRKKYRKITKSKLFKYKVRYAIIISIIAFSSLGGFVVIAKSFGLFESSRKLDVGVEAALFFIDEGTSVYDMNIDGILPDGVEHEYVFTVSNFEGDDVSQVDMSYSIELVTTTNLPLEYYIYKEGSSILGPKTTKKDTNYAWYNYYKSNNNYTFAHGEKRTDTYRLVIVFPNTFNQSSVYAGQIESIQIVVDSKQLLGSE